MPTLDWIGKKAVVNYHQKMSFHLWNDDSKEKQALGELWEKRSEGRCLFVMPIGKDYEAIKRTL